MPATITRPTDAVLIHDLNGMEVWASKRQAETLALLEGAAHGAFAAVHGYIPESGWKVRPVCTYQFISKFSTMSLYARKIEALKALNFTDIKCDHPKLAALTKAEQIDLFNERRAMEIASMEKTEQGCRDDAMRQAHDRCYFKSSQGIRCHLLTEKDADGIMQPIIVDGHPVIKSILVHAIVVKRIIVQAGERKVVNSGCPVLMSQTIKRACDCKTISFQQFSLKDDNFDHLTISGMTFDVDDIAAIKAMQEDATDDE